MACSSFSLSSFHPNPSTLSNPGNTKTQTWGVCILMKRIFLNSHQLDHKEGRVQVGGNLLGTILEQLTESQILLPGTWAMPSHILLSVDKYRELDWDISQNLFFFFFFWLWFFRWIWDSSAWPRIVPNVLLATSLQATGEPERATSGKMLTPRGVPLIPERKVLSAFCYALDSSLNAWCVSKSSALKCFFPFFFYSFFFFS